MFLYVLIGCHSYLPIVCFYSQPLLITFMKLLDSSEVCTLLGISKSTLYRWCGVSDDPLERSRTLSVAHLSPKIDAIGDMRRAMERLDETPGDFPRPFKIGRAFKWKDDEILAWLETKRV